MLDLTEGDGSCERKKEVLSQFFLRGTMLTCKIPPFYISFFLESF